MQKFDKERYLAAWRTEAAAFRAVVAEADPAQPVPSCPEWTIGDLLGHTNRVTLNYVTSAGRPTPPEADTLPEAAGEPLAAFDSACAALDATLTGLSLDAKAWNPAPVPKNSRFWFRRAMCEIAVHRWDAQMAIGSPEPVAVPVAVEGVQEILDSFLPAGYHREVSPDTLGVVMLHAVDAAQKWCVRLRGEKVAVLDSEGDDLTSPPDVQVSGAASDLNLALWGRVPFDVMDVTGDAELLDSVRLH